jgi:hypothetical protein
MTAMHELAAGERWAQVVTTELIRRGERERGWLAELRNAAVVPGGS